MQLELLLDKHWLRMPFVLEDFAAYFVEYSQKFKLELWGWLYDFDIFVSNFVETFPWP